MTVKAKRLSRGISRICSNLAHWTVVMSVALLLRGLPLAAQNPQSTLTYKLCFPLTSTPPNIASLDPNDPGWTGAFTYNMTPTNASDPSATIVVRGIRDSSNNLYLLFSTNTGDTNIQDPPQNNYVSTVVSLAFDPGDLAFPDASRQQRVDIFPVGLNPTAMAAPASPLQVNYFGHGGNLNGSNQVIWNLPVEISTIGPPQGNPPTWILDSSNNFKVKYSQDASLNWIWYLGMKIPSKTTPNSAVHTTSDEIQLPTTGSFGLYIDVFVVRAAAGGGHYYWTAHWPAVTPLPVPCTLAGGCTDPPTPGASGWGTSPAVNTALCGGVSINSQVNDIFTSNTPNSKICTVAGITTSGGVICPPVPNVNVFKATVHNSMVDGSGAGQTASGVQATFASSPWGLATTWDVLTLVDSANNVVPLGNNPTAPQDLSPPPGATVLTTASWFPVPASFNPSAYPHRCIKVQLSSAAGSNAFFLNDVAYQNMDFVKASRFSRNAEISAKGDPRRLKADGTAEPDQLFDLRVTMREEVENPGQPGAAQQAGGTAPNAATLPRGKHGGQVVSRLTWVLEGCRHTGRYMTIKGHTLEVCEAVGSFGYVVRHAGNVPVRKWKVNLTREGVELPGNNNRYALHVPQDGVATVNTSVEPIESKLAAFLDLGAGIPNGTFGNVFNTGFSLNAGLEYMINSHFSAEGIFGYHHFPAKIGSSLNVYQFSANGKAYLATGMVRPFVNGGIGGYTFSPGSTNFGGNGGGGVLFELTSRLGLQGSYNFHAVNTPGTVTKFSSLQGGARFVF